MDLPDPGTEPPSPASPALAGKFFTTEIPGKPWYLFKGEKITFPIQHIKHIFIIHTNNPCVPVKNQLPPQIYLGKKRDLFHLQPLVERPLPLVIS